MRSPHRIWKQTLPLLTLSQPLLHTSHPWPSPPRVSLQLDYFLSVSSNLSFPSSLSSASFLSGLPQKLNIFFFFFMQRDSTLSTSQSRPSLGVRIDSTSRLKEAHPSLISFLLRLFSHMLCVSIIHVTAMLCNKDAALRGWWKQTLISSKIVLHWKKKKTVTNNNKCLLLTHRGDSAQHL